MPVRGRREHPPIGSGAVAEESTRRVAGAVADLRAGCPAVAWSSRRCSSPTPGGALSRCRRSSSTCSPAAAPPSHRTPTRRCSAADRRAGCGIRTTPAATCAHSSMGPACTGSPRTSSARPSPSASTRRAVRAAERRPPRRHPAQPHPGRLHGSEVAGPRSGRRTAAHAVTATSALCRPAPPAATPPPARRLRKCLDTGRTGLCGRGFVGPR